MCEYNISYSGNESPRPTICRDDKQMSIEEVVKELNRLRAVAVEAHRVILHEMDSGRTPFMLKAKNGGKGLGYFEDALS